MRTYWITLAALGLVAAGCGGNTPGGDGGETETGTESDSDPTPGSTAPSSSAGDPTSDTEGETESGMDESSTGTDSGEPEEIIPPPGGVRRLLAHQYVDSIRTLLGAEAATAAAPPEDPSVGYFDAMATLSSVPAPADIELYEGSSSDVATAAVENPSTLAESAPCVIDGPFDDACYRAVATDFGRLAWRRPVTDTERDRIADIGIAAQAWDDGAFDTGLQYMLTAILQSPNFLYIVEIGDAADDGEYRELNGYEMATRMSFFLVGRTPSSSVLDDAEAGALDSDEGVRDLAATLLNNARARTTIGRFYGEFLTVRDVTTRSKDPDLFPEFSDALTDAMLEETMLLVEDVVFDRNASVLELFEADYTFINDDLAALYGMSPPGGWEMVDLPANEGRAGVLTHGSWLAMMSHTDVNSPTRRGLFVMEQLLCTEIPLPPPRVNPEPIVPTPGVTLREALMQHVEDPSCATCHAIIDPVGFAFEHYDPTGAYRTLDNGLPIDATGDVGGLGAFDGAAELVSLVAADPRLPRCLVNQAFAQGLGFVPDAGQEPALDDVGIAYSDEGHKMRRMLIELMASPVFRRVDEPK